MGGIALVAFCFFLILPIWFPAISRGPVPLKPAVAQVGHGEVCETGVAKEGIIFLLTFVSAIP
jgi:hypothetical protein